MLLFRVEPLVVVLLLSYSTLMFGVLVVCLQLKALDIFSFLVDDFSHDMAVFTKRDV